MDREWLVIPVVVAVWLATSLFRGALAQSPDPIEYDSTIHLDAESLAEGGMVEGYDQITGSIGNACAEWAQMTQSADGTADYSIHILGETHLVYGTSTRGDDPWAMSSAVLFHVVNKQLDECDFKVYAINGGNDLHAIPLSLQQFRQAHKYHKRPSDKPYIPTFDPPRYGFPE